MSKTLPWVGVAMIVLAAPAAAQIVESQGGWLASEAFTLTFGNGITSALSLWRDAEYDRAELRVAVVRARDAVDATAAWLWVDGEAQLLDCRRMEATFLDTPGFRACFQRFPGIHAVTTVSRCALDWETSQRIIGGAAVDIQIDTELKLLKRQHLSQRQLAKLRFLSSPDG